MADKKFYTWKQIEKMSVYLADLVEDKFFTHIIGVSRGGCIPATIISHRLNLPMIPVTIATRDHAKEWIPDFPIGHGDGVGYIDRYKFLVVDDINDTGHTFKRMKEIMHHRGAIYTEYAVLIDNEPSEFDVDYWAEKIDKSKDPAWIVYPWEV
jgi:hypoxanthine phosphoribosyltransferase